MANVSVLFEDRDGNQRPTSLWFPFTISASDLQTAMNLFVTRAGAISDASIRKWDVTYSWEEYGSSTASQDSDVLRRGALFYRNASVYETIWVPSINSALSESSGDYAGIRLDAARTDVAAILTAMQDFVSFICTPEVEPFPTVFVAGGIAL
jgi:hypothetical protein